MRQDGWCFWSKEEWPANSPDLNPLDYSIWNAVEGKACRDPAPSLATLKSRVGAAWRSLDDNFIRKCCARFRARLQEVIDNEGGRIEGRRWRK